MVGIKETYTRGPYSGRALWSEGIWEVQEFQQVWQLELMSIQTSVVGFHSCTLPRISIVTQSSEVSLNTPDFSVIWRAHEGSFTWFLSLSSSPLLNKHLLISYSSWKYTIKTQPAFINELRTTFQVIFPDRDKYKLLKNII